MAQPLLLDRDHIVSNDWSGVITWMNRRKTGEFAAGTSVTSGGGAAIAISPDRKVLAADAFQDGTAGFELFAIDPGKP